jgi:predicted transport protein
MPLYQISDHKLAIVEVQKFPSEKHLQALIERNLETVFNCRFVASEFPTGAKHGGRIDTLAISEDNNPVIIEYKKQATAELVTQSLYYLSWIHDHRGDYEVVARKSLGNNLEVDWSDVRVICISPNYSKFDLHAVNVLGASMELWSFRLYKDQNLFLEKIQTQEETSVEGENIGNKNPVMVLAGKKAAIARAMGNYTFEEHINEKSEKVRDIALAVQEFISGIDPALEESPKKFYVAYRISQNIVCMEVMKQQVVLYIKLNPKEIGPLPAIARDTTDIGHYGTGDLEITLKNIEDLEIAKPYIEAAYKKVGG